MARRDIDIPRLIRDRRLREKLYNAGFFFADYPRHLFSISKVMDALGRTADDLTPEAFFRFIHPDDLQSYSALWERVREGWEEEFYSEYRFRDAEGEYHWVQTHALVIDRNADGDIETIVGIDTNIDSRKRAEIYLRTQFLDTKRRFEMAESLRVAGTVVTSDLELEKSLEVGLEQLHHIVEYDQVEVFLREDDTYTRLAKRGESPEGSLPDPDPLLREATESMFPVIKDDLGEGFALRSWIGVPLRLAGTSAGAILLWHSSPGYYRGADLYPIMAFGDSLAVAINNGQRFLRTVADLETDQLTGFLTRKSFDRSAATLWADRSGRVGVTSVVMLDLDNFKRVNDRFGHQAGDHVIESVAAVCRSALRKGDVLGRYGGEEFVAILPGANRDAAERIMERIRKACEELVVAEIEGHVTVSVGAAITDGTEELRDVIAAADKALLEAKKRGRNRVVFADEI